MNFNSYLCPVVIDIGSNTCKAGFSKDDFPKSVFRSKIIKHPNSDKKHSRYLIGNETRELSEFYYTYLNFPIQKRNVTNWDRMEILLYHIFENELAINCYEEHPVFLTESSKSTKEDRHEMAEIMFEKLGVPCINSGTQPVLSMYASGCTTGVVLDSGDGLTEIVQVNEGYPIKENNIILDLGGSDLTNYLHDLFKYKCYSFNFLASVSEKELVKEIKEKLCYVSNNYEQEVNYKYEPQTQPIENFYELPDGQVIILGQERIKCPEVLFKPYFYGPLDKGIHEHLNESIENMMEKNVVISGGNTMFPGFVERLKTEMNGINIIAPPRRKYSSWIGSSIVASLSAFQLMWISKKEYQEYGDQIVEFKNLYF